MIKKALSNCLEFKEEEEKELRLTSLDSFQLSFLQGLLVNTSCDIPSLV